MAHEYTLEEILERIKLERQKDIELLRETAFYTFRELSDPQLEKLYEEYSNGWSASWLKILEPQDINNFVDWATTTPLEKIKTIPLYEDLENWVSK